MGLLAKTVSKIQRIEVLSGEQPQRDHRETQYASSQGVVLNERDVVNVFATFADGRIVNFLVVWHHDMEGS